MKKQSKYTTKRNRLARKNYTSKLAWESAVAAEYGGSIADWPAWAQKVYREE